MDSLYSKGIRNKDNTFVWTDYKDSNINNSNNEYLLNTNNNYSELKHNYPNTRLKNIYINFGFPRTKNSYQYQNCLSLIDYPIFEQRNIFYYDKNFKLFKNTSLSRYGERKFSTNSKRRYYSPHHKIITTMRKTKLVDDEDLNESVRTRSRKNKAKNALDVYELQVINQITYEDGDLDEKNNKIIRGETVDEQWGQIEQNILENETIQNDNMLNSVYVEIEKGNGEKQLKIVEITKEEKYKQEPCINIKYSLLDKICLDSNSNTNNTMYDSQYVKDSNNYIHERNGSSISSTKNYSQIKKVDNSILKSDYASEPGTKEQKSNVYSSVGSDGMFFSGSMSSSKRFQKYSKYQKGIMDDNKNELNNEDKEYLNEKPNEIEVEEIEDKENNYDDKYLRPKNKNFFKDNNIYKTRKDNIIKKNKLQKDIQDNDNNNQNENDNSQKRKRIKDIVRRRKSQDNDKIENDYNNNKKANELIQYKRKFQKPVKEQQNNQDNIEPNNFEIKNTNKGELYPKKENKISNTKSKEESITKGREIYQEKNINENKPKYKNETYKPIKRIIYKKREQNLNNYNNVQEENTPSITKKKNDISSKEYTQSSQKMEQEDLFTPSRQSVNSGIYRKKEGLRDILDKRNKPYFENEQAKNYPQQMEGIADEDKEPKNSMSTYGKGTYKIQRYKNNSMINLKANQNNYVDIKDIIRERKLEKERLKYQEKEENKIEEDFKKKGKNIDMKQTNIEDNVNQDNNRKNKDNMIRQKLIKIREQSKLKDGNLNNDKLDFENKLVDNEKNTEIVKDIQEKYESRSVDRRKIKKEKKLKVEKDNDEKNENREIEEVDEAELNNEKEIPQKTKNLKNYQPNPSEFSDNIDYPESSNNVVVNPKKMEYSESQTIPEKKRTINRIIYRKNAHNKNNANDDIPKIIEQKESKIIPKEENIMKPRGIKKVDKIRQNMDKKNLKIEVNDENGNYQDIENKIAITENIQNYNKHQQDIINEQEEPKLKIDNLSTLNNFNNLPANIKIYKCIIWKSTNPNVNENTISGVIRRTGSQILDRGGFVMKLPQKHQRSGSEISQNI